MRKEREDPGPHEDLWQKRQALQLAAQLPDDHAAALAIVRHLEALVRTFMLSADARPAFPTVKFPATFQSRRLKRGVSRRLVRNRYNPGSRPSSG